MWSASAARQRQRWASSSSSSSRVSMRRLAIASRTRGHRCFAGCSSGQIAPVASIGRATGCYVLNSYAIGAPLGVAKRWRHGCVAGMPTPPGLKSQGHREETSMTLSDDVVVVGSVEILALLAVLVALGCRGRKAARLALGPRADPAWRETGRKAG